MSIARHAVRVDVLCEAGVQPELTGQFVHLVQLVGVTSAVRLFVLVDTAVESALPDTAGTECDVLHVLRSELIFYFDSVKC